MSFPNPKRPHEDDIGGPFWSLPPPYKSRRFITRDFDLNFLAELTIPIPDQFDQITDLLTYLELFPRRKFAIVQAYGRRFGNAIITLNLADGVEEITQTTSGRILITINDMDKIIMYLNLFGAAITILHIRAYAFPANRLEQLHRMIGRSVTNLKVLRIFGRIMYPNIVPNQPFENRFQHVHWLLLSEVIIGTIFSEFPIFFPNLRRLEIKKVTILQNDFAFVELFQHLERVSIEDIRPVNYTIFDAERIWQNSRRCKDLYIILPFANGVGFGQLMNTLWGKPALESLYVQLGFETIDVTLTEIDKILRHPQLTHVHLMNYGVSTNEAAYLINGLAILEIFDYRHAPITPDTVIDDIIPELARFVSKPIRGSVDNETFLVKLEIGYVEEEDEEEDEEEY